MNKALRYSLLLILALVFTTGLPLTGNTTAEAAPQICPLIGCANDEYCRRDRDCNTAPNGVCNLFCPTRGCCSYPAA